MQPSSGLRSCLFRTIRAQLGTMKAPEVATAESTQLPLYLRLVLSYKDFKHAKRCCEYLVTQHAALEKHGGDDLTARALYCSMIVSYARPFNSSGTSRLGRVPPLRDEYLSTLAPEDLELHRYILWCRNKLIAHNDAEAVDPLPYVATDLPGDIVIPETNDSLAPFTLEATRHVLVLFENALHWAVLLRRDLEPQILHLLERRPFNPGDSPHHAGT